MFLLETKVIRIEWESVKALNSFRSYGLRKTTLPVISTIWKAFFSRLKPEKIDRVETITNVGAVSVIGPYCYFVGWFDKSISFLRLRYFIILVTGIKWLGIFYMLSIYKTANRIRIVVQFRMTLCTLSVTVRIKAVILHRIASPNHMRSKSEFNGRMY